MVAHDRHYKPDTELYATKFAAWNASVSTIAAHWALGTANSADQPTYTLGLTAFADWTDDEFRATYLAAPTEKCDQLFSPHLHPINRLFCQSQQAGLPAIH